MTRLLSFLFLLLIWCGLSNDFSASNIGLGFAFILLLQVIILPRRFQTEVNLFYLLALIVFVLYELIISSVQVALEILTPRQLCKPRLVTVPIHSQSTMQISLMANLLSLTPGTLTVDISAENKQIQLHAMFGQSQESIEHFITNQLEKLVMKALPHAKN